jgi:hypothetical protein
MDSFTCRASLERYPRTNIGAERSGRSRTEDICRGKHQNLAPIFTPTDFTQLKDILTLKQQQAGVIEAGEAVELARVTLFQGRTIMLFTIVTIVFVCHSDNVAQPSPHHTSCRCLIPYFLIDLSSPRAIHP